MLGICQAIPFLLMWKCTYWPLTSYRDNRRSNQLSPPWKLIGMDHSTLWAMVSFINIWSPLKSFLSLFWNFADCLLWVARKNEVYRYLSLHRWCSWDRRKVKCFSFYQLQFEESWSTRLIMYYTGLLIYEIINVSLRITCSKGFSTKRTGYNTNCIGAVTRSNQIEDLYTLYYNHYFLQRNLDFLYAFRWIIEISQWK